MTTPIPAVVTIPDLTLVTTLSTSALFEAVQTTAGVIQSVSVSLAQIISAAIPQDGLVVIPPASTTIASTVVAAQVNATAPISLVVPNSVVWRAANNRTVLSVVDISGSASLNNITLTFTGGQAASGFTTLPITTDFGGFNLQPTTTGWVVV